MPVTVRTFDRLAEAASALTADRGARFLGGGTLVMRALNEGDVGISTVIRTTDRSLREIRAGGSRIELGAAVTMAQILRSPDLAFLHPVARAIGAPALRTTATVAGNLFAPAPYGDFAAALLALDGRVTVQSGFSPREMTLEELLRSRERSPGLVAGVAFARPATPTSFRFLKVTRVHPKGLAVLTIAAHLPEASGRITGARVTYGAMAPTPIRVPAVERALEGCSLNPAGIEGALRAATEGTSPPTDAIASTWYRREVAPVHLRRLLLGEDASARPWP